MKKGRLPQPDSEVSLSRLESLPVELLQAIFLYTLNINLPLASPYLGLALSSEHLYTKLILLAFSGIGQRHSEGMLHEDVTSASLQTTIMSRKWFNLDLMRRCQVQFAQEMLERAQSDQAWEITSAETTKVGLDGRTTRHSYRLSHGCLRRGIVTYQGSIETSVRVAKVNSGWVYWFPSCMTRWWVDRSENVLLPEKLLHGPWTEAKLDLLEMLCRAGAMVDWVNTSTGEIAERGLNDAIMEGNLRAVKLLTQSPVWITRKLACQNVGVRIDTRHARLAVQEAGCDLDIIEALLQHPKSTIDLNDRQIVAWAVKLDSEGSIKGRQLLDSFYKKKFPG